jgi:hypothetical protein
MHTKLTVRVDQELVQVAKRYAHRQGTSLSKLIEDYLRGLAITQNEPLADTPVLQRLTGILPPDTSVDEYHQHLQEKYG